MFERKELIKLRGRATDYAGIVDLNPSWTRAYLELADAANNLDAMMARTEDKNGEELAAANKKIAEFNKTENFDQIMEDVRKEKEDNKKRVEQDNSALIKMLVYVQNLCEI